MSTDSISVDTEVVHIEDEQDEHTIPITLDELAQLGAEDFVELYRSGKTPKMEDLEGPMRGRMLAAPAMQTPPVASLLNKFAASGAFPWQGKTFRYLGEGKGEGINRVLGNRYNWFRFETSIGPSRAGDFEAFQLDYDFPHNPGLIRRVKDEMREVSPGVWLGLAYLKVGQKYHMAVFFGLALEEVAPPPPVKSNKARKLTTLGTVAFLGALTWWLVQKRRNR